jgi:hypothetical protein
MSAADSNIHNKHTSVHMSFDLLLSNPWSFPRPPRLYACNHQNCFGNAVGAARAEALLRTHAHNHTLSSVLTSGVQLDSSLLKGSSCEGLQHAHAAGTHNAGGPCKSCACRLQFDSCAQVESCNTRWKSSSSHIPAMVAAWWAPCNPQKTLKHAPAGQVVAGQSAHSHQKSTQSYPTYHPDRIAIQYAAAPLGYKSTN